MTACGICRTDLHVLDGDLTHPNLPLIPGHQIIGEIAGLGDGVANSRCPASAWACRGWRQVAATGGHCTHYRENLCDEARAIPGTRSTEALRGTIVAAAYCLRFPHST
ncbi:MAG: alcohol dehydrogenase catalytic domain-containing protein [Haliea sp.]|nr:alcohol dehydrogenase catalytic domain-containing protein [Haliea sp.]